MVKNCLQKIAENCNDLNQRDDDKFADFSELCTILQEIYKVNQNGGHGSRRKVSQLLLELGLTPNKSA